MVNFPWEIIKELESNNSRLFKESVILQHAIKNNDEFFSGLKYALDSLITFGVKNIPIHSGINPNGDGVSWDYFKELLDNLSLRKLTGNAAKLEINRYMQLSTPLQWDFWYRRILIKDLRCGVSVKTVNKAVTKKFPKYKIPVFTCQLADDIKNHANKNVGVRMIDTKMDGVRILNIVYPNCNVDQLSRYGNELLNFKHIKTQIADIASDLSEPMVFDGEIVSASFQDLMTQVHRKTNINATDAKLYLFDLIPLKDFKNGKCNQTQLSRREDLQSWHDKYHEKLPDISVLGFELVDLDTKEGKTRFQEINNEALSAGAEGIMSKDPNAPYELKRSSAWLKMKPYIDVTLEILGVEEGTGKNAGRLGAFICGGVDDGKYIDANVGGGLTDNDRIYFWNHREYIVGKLIEVRADAITQNKNGNYSIRFGRYLRFRSFDNRVKEKI